MRAEPNHHDRAADSPQRLAIHMKVLGIAASMRAALDVIDAESRLPFRCVLSYVQAAYGAELLVKAAIAKHDPFALWPEHAPVRGADHVDLDALVANARPWTSDELARQYEASVGRPMVRLDELLEFLRRRSTLESVRVPRELDLGDAVLRFLAVFVEPFVFEHWERSIVDDINFFYPDKVPALVERLRSLTGGPLPGRANAAGRASRGRGTVETAAAAMERARPELRSDGRPALTALAGGAGGDAGRRKAL